MRRASVATILVAAALVGCSSNDTDAESVVSPESEVSSVATPVGTDALGSSTEPSGRPVTQMSASLPEFTDRPVVLWFWAPG